jgi:hypothetical protein
MRGCIATTRICKCLLFFLPIVKGTFEGPDWCEGLLLQNSASAYYEFERVGVAQITVFEWLGGVEEQLVCTV